ncbi:PIN domain-containing protein [Candidatus Woesearchaeota archaeon]|nr:PIN domain-containing protein [Candidatus Woesearchaeota archaeon]
MIYVTDTHSLIWFLTRDPKLWKDALAAFRSADDGKSLMIIPSIAIAEIIYIIERKGVGIKFGDLLNKFEESINYVVYSLNLEVLIELEKFTKLNDIHDRIIVATAKICNSKLITIDKNIRNSGYVDII